MVKERTIILLEDYKGHKKGSKLKKSEKLCDIYIDRGIAEYYTERELRKIKKIKEDKPNLKETLTFMSKEVLALILNNNKPEASEKIVEYIKKNNVVKTTRNDDKSEVWIYREGIFVPEGKTYIQETTRKILGKAYTTHFVNQVISKIEADNFIDQEKFFNEQNKYPELIAVNNGILDIKTKTLKEFSDKIPFFNKLPMDYIPGVKCENFIKFIGEILNKQKDIDCIQELFGYALYKKYKYKKAFMFEGGGDNGKTQLLKILTEHFVGLNNSKELSLAQIEKDTYLVSELQNKLVNVSADITQAVMDNTGTFKNITGGDPVSCQRKYKTSLTIVNYAKMIFATNELPQTKDDSSGFWGRWVLIEFPYKFLKQEEINLLPEEEKTNVKLAKPDVIDSIINEKELQGILNWSLEGFERLEKQKDFSYDSSRMTTKDRWTKKANSFLAFSEEHIFDDYDGYLIKEDLRKLYLAYCKQHKLKIQDDKTIKSVLEEEFGVGDRQIWIPSGVFDGLKEKQKKIRIWEGINCNYTTLTNVTRGVRPLEEKEKNAIVGKHHGNVGKPGINKEKEKQEKTIKSEDSFSTNPLKKYLNPTNLNNYFFEKQEKNENIIKINIFEKELNEMFDFVQYDSYLQKFIDAKEVMVYPNEIHLLETFVYLEGLKK